MDAFHGGYVPFHLLTREFYTLLKQRLAPDGAAAFNVHDGTRLTLATQATLRAVFPALDLFPSGEGEVIAVVSRTPQDRNALLARAKALQERYKFRFSLLELFAKRIEPAAVKADVLTDDFAPVNLYDAIRDKDRKRK